MHLPSSLTPLVAFLALLTKATAQDSAPFELKSQVILDGGSTFDGLYFTAFSYHPGGFYYATLSQPSDNGNPALVSVLTGPTGNQTLKTTNLDGYDAAYIAIGAGSTNAPAIYDSVTIVPSYPTTYGFTFVDDVLTWNEVAGEFYGTFSITLSVVVEVLEY